MHPALALASLLAAAPATGGKVFGPGEQTIFDLGWAGVHAGTVTVTVGASTKLGTKDVWPIVTVAETESVFELFPLHDKLVTWWDPAAQHTVGFDFYASENGKRRRERCKFAAPAPGKATVQRVDEDTEPSTATVDVDPNAFDIAAGFFSLRSQELVPGKDYRVPIFTGWRSWDMNVHVDAPETVQVPAGKFEALPLEVEVHFQGKLESKRRLKLWVTHDAHHALVKISAEFLVGTMQAEATQLHLGND